MRSNKNYFGLLKPQAEESFSGWLSRGVRSKNSEPFARVISLLKESGVEDADQKLTAPLLRKISGILGVTQNHLDQAFFDYGSWLKSPPELREYMCELCLLEDFSSHRRPTVRRVWAHWWFNVCPVHGSLVSATDSTVASVSLFNFLHNYMGPTPNPSPRSRQALFTVRQHKALGSKTYKKLRVMAYFFQQWYSGSLSKKYVRIPGAESIVPLVDFELVMSDLLAIIGKKRSYPYHQESYIARLLDINGECSLSVRLSPSAGREACLCFDISEHPPNVRMAMFALLGLFIGLPSCTRQWLRGEDYWIQDNNLERLWWGMHSELGQNLGFLEWLQDRSRNWNVAIRNNLSHLLEDWWKKNH